MRIVLVEPQIPQNTGNIARLCATTASELHLVRPLGFETSNYYLRRAGLDYWDKVQLTFHESFESFWARHQEDRCWFASTKARNLYTRIEYAEDDFLIFGNETHGLSNSFIDAHPAGGVTIPMWNDTRSLNLSNAVAIVVYEALRQVRRF